MNVCSPIKIAFIWLTLRHFNTQNAPLGLHRLSKIQKEAQIEEKWVKWSLPTDNKRFPGTQEGCAGHYCIIPKARCLDHSCRTLFFSKQYIKCSFGKEREAEACKQTEIVIAPIRLNRKPSQLDVYSEPGCRGQGLLREHFLDSEQTDGAASGGRWQLRQTRVHLLIACCTDACKDLQADDEQ